MNLKIQYFKIILLHFYIVLEEILEYTTQQDRSKTESL